MQNFVCDVIFFGFVQYKVINFVLSLPFELEKSERLCLH